MAGDHVQNSCHITEESADALPAYGRIPIAFEVQSVFDVRVVDRGLGGFVLSERRLQTPYVKDYDAVKGERPTRWAKHRDLPNWGVLCASVNGMRVGGCVIAYDTPGVNMLEGRKDLAVLWDLRVRPDFRYRGTGSKLFDAAVAWAVARKCRHLKVETQNINVPACRFYAKQGCILGAVDRFAYDEFPDEVQLLWYRDLIEPDTHA